jgi:rSAM/selenodomain-associated transferase 1
MNSVRLVLFTRYPEPGKAKTRLIPALGAAGAAVLHRRLTEHTVAVARASRLQIEVRTTGASQSTFAEWLGNDVSLVDQGDGDLGDRLRRAAPPYPVLFIGADLPDLQTEYLIDAARLLATERVVLGPAEDGGYWALGLAEPCESLFDDMPWGTDQVLTKTLARLADADIVPALLPTLADLDRPEDLSRWPELTG